MDMVTKRLIFTLAPGRCGTRYLMKMLETISSVYVRHEPEPDFADYAEAAQCDSTVARKFWTEHKLPFIESIPQSIYIETSHVFISGFVESLLDMNVAFDAVVLTRPHREVALSLWRRRSFPGRTERGRKYLLNPNSLANVLNFYQLCFWHCLETERRTLRHIEQIRQRGGLIAETSLSTITTETGFCELVNNLSLPEPDWIQYHGRKDWHVNANPHGYSMLWPEKDLDNLEQQVYALKGA